MAVIISLITKLDDRGIAKTQKRLAEMGSSAKGFGGSLAADMIQAGAALDRVGQRASNAGKTLTMGLTLPIVALGAGAWKVGAEYDASMRQVQAASGATGEQMAQLGAMAKQMGYSTMFAATDASAAMLELAKSGITPAQMAAGALEATMLMAAAGGLELGSAAESVANTLNMFGLGAGDAAQVANALAGGANASSASVDSLRQALAQVGPGARNAGLDLQTTTAILAAFANKGIQGSDAGTSLKTMLARLIPMTAKSAKAMKQYGLDFTDAQGKILPMTAVAQQLQDKLGGLSMEQRNAALATIFGSDATRAATVLMQEGTSGLRKYIKATSDRAAAGKMAAAQEKSDMGQTKAAIAALKTAAIDVQQALAPMVRAVANKIGAMARAFGKLSPETKTLIVKIGLVAAALGPALFAFGKLTSGVGKTIKVLGNVGLAFGKNAKAAPLYARAIAGVTRGIGSLAKGAISGTAAMGRWAAAQTVAAAKTVANTAATVASRVAQVAAAGAAKAMAAAQWLLNAAMSANPIGIVVAALAALGAAIAVAWKKSETFRRILTTAWNAIKAAAKAVFGFLVGYFKAWVGSVRAALSGIAGVVSAVIGFFRRIKDGVVGAFRAVTSWLSGVGRRIKDAIGDLGNLLYDVGKAVIEGFWNGLKAVWNKVTGWVSDAGSAIKRGFKSLFGINSPSRVFRGYGASLMDGLALGIRGGLPRVGQAMGLVNGTVAAGVGLAGYGAGGVAVRSSGAGGRSVLVARGAVVVNVTVGAGADAAQVAAGVQAGVDPALQRLARAIAAL